MGGNYMIGKQSVENLITHAKWELEREISNKHKDLLRRIRVLEEHLNIEYIEQFSEPCLPYYKEYKDSKK